MRHKIVVLSLLCVLVFEAQAQSARPDVLLPFGHTSEISCIDISSDGKWVVSAANKTILIWDIKTGIPIKKIDWGDYVLKLFFFQNDSKLMVVSSSGVNAYLGATHYYVYDLKIDKIIQQGPSNGSDNTELTSDGRNLIFQASKANNMMGSSYYSKEDRLIMWNVEKNNRGGIYNYSGAGAHPGFVFYPLFDPAYFVTVTNQRGENSRSGEEDTSYLLHVWNLQKSVHKVDSSNPTNENEVPKPLSSMNIGSHVNAVCASKYDRFFATASESGVQIWRYIIEKSSGNINFLPMSLSPLIKGQVQSMDFSENRTLLVCSQNDTGSQINIIDIQKQQITHVAEFYGHKKDLLVRFSPTGEYIVAKDSTSLVVYDNKGLLVRTMQKKVTDLSVGRFTSDDKKIITYHSLYMIDSYKKLQDSLDYNIWFLSAKATNKNIVNAKAAVKDSLFRLYTENMIRGGYKRVQRDNARVWDLSNGMVVNYVTDTTRSQDTVSADRSHVILGDYYSTGYKKSFGAAMHAMRNGAAALNKQYGNEMDASNDFNRTMSAVIPVVDDEKSYMNRGYGPKLKLVNKATKDTLMMISVDTSDWIILCRDGYYMSSTEAAKSLGYFLNTKVYTFDQFDLQYNRPDIVLKRIGIADSSTIEAYKKAYEKRLKLMGFIPENFNKSLVLNAPAIKVNTIGSYTFQSTSKHFTVKLDASDLLCKLDRLNLYINGVPQYGSKGYNLKTRNARVFSDTLGFELSNGRNVVEISVLNEKGIASLTERFQVEYLGPQRKPNLYIVAIGAGKYTSSQHNLDYARKDANDVAALLATNSRYGKVIPVVLTDEQVTKNAVRAVKKTLFSSNIDDEIIIFYAGHGVINSSKEYYLGTYDMNFEQPQNGGIPYEDLDNLLQDIPARQKLLLIDACHSGEIDREETSIVKRPTTAGVVTFRSIGELAVAYKRVGLENSFQMMKQVFTDLRRSTGATVISSASGVESAFEGDVWRNGVFTYCLLSGIKEHKADFNGDNRITASELQRYIQVQVSELTQGKQTPTSRVENFITDFIVW